MIGRTASVISPFYSLLPGIDFLKYTAYHRLILHTLLVLDHSLVYKKKYVLNFVEKKFFLLLNNNIASKKYILYINKVCLRLYTLYAKYAGKNNMYALIFFVCEVKYIMNGKKDFSCLSKLCFGFKNISLINFEIILFCLSLYFLLLGFVVL